MTCEFICLLYIEKKIHVVDTKNIRLKMSSHIVTVHEGHVPHSSRELGYELSNVERYLADIRANLILFEETHDICMGLRDILESYTRPVQAPHASID